MAFPPRGFKKNRVQLRVQFNETLEMRAGRWHQRCLGKEENSARPLAARITGYFSRASMRKWANDRSWHEAAKIHVRSNVGFRGVNRTRCAHREPLRV